MADQDFTINTTLRGLDLVFKTTYDLFSYKKIDEGTRMLCETLDIKPGSLCLDLGCGYGVAGIVMGKVNPDGKIVFVDKDFVAVDYTKINCELNRVKNYQALLSNGFSNLVGVKFDVIASNLPTHIAQESLRQMITDAKTHLQPQGKFYIVSVNRLRPYMQRELEKVFPTVTSAAHTGKYSVMRAE